MQLGGNMMMMGGMGSFGNGGTQLFSFSSNAMTGGAGGVSGGGAGGAGMGGGGMASAPGRLPQNAQTTAESIAGDILSDGPVALTSAADAAPSSAPLALAGLDSKLVASGSRKPSGAADGAGDAHKIKAAAHGGSQPCSGDGKGAMVQAEQQLSEFMPQSSSAARAAQTRTAAANPCAQGGGAARERGRGNQSFVAYGLVNGGRGVAQAADLGRSALVSGAVSDVFRVSYHVINAPRYVRGLGLRNNYFCTSPFGENICAGTLALNKVAASPEVEQDHDGDRGPR